jgi:lipoprotein-anchoring transpeptidase ErfK/SrfK
VNNLKGINGVRAAALASATFALMAGLSTPAAALPGLFGDFQSVAPPRPAINAARAARPAVPVRAKARVAKTSPTTPGLIERPRGPLQILISLDRQQLTLYSGGEVIGRSRVSSGQRGHATPTGVFSIIQKDRWHRSNIYDDAPMYFMQRITWSGVAMHQGIVPNYPASHGCVRLPAAFAQQLWTTTQVGARVIITHDQIAPVEIEHPALFMPKREPAPAVAQVDSIKAAQQAWTFAELANSQPLAAMTMTDLAPSSSEPPAFAAPDTLQQRPPKPGPVSVFISRKEGKLFVRKGFEPLFDVPVTIDRANEPLGTHVFTAIASKGDAGLRWNVVTVTAQSGGTAQAKAALDRIAIPQATIDRISELVGPGASLIVSDQGLGPETGRGTDFIVLTR